MKSNRMTQWIALIAMMTSPLMADETNELPDVTLDKVRYGKVVNEVEFSKDQLAGKVVVVERWSTTCGPCVAFLPELAKIHRRYDSKGLEVIGLETGGSAPDKIADLCKDARVGYPVMKGGGVPVRINRIPHACVFGTDGKLVWEGPPHDAEFLRSIKDALRKVGTADEASNETAEESEAAGPLVALRDWTNSEGKTMRAELLRVNDQEVVFRIDGREVLYAIAKLSEGDQEFIRGIE